MLVWSRIIQLWEKRISALNFDVEQISNFRLSTDLSVIYNGQMDITKQATTKKC